MARTPRTFSPATCLSCRQPFSAQLGLACRLEDGTPTRSAWRRLRDRLRRDPDPGPGRGPSHGAIHDRVVALAEQMRRRSEP